MATVTSIAITPGGLGVREGIVAAVATISGIEPDASIVAVGLDRLISTTVIVGIGTIYSHFLSKAITETEERLSDVKSTEEEPMPSPI